MFLVEATHELGLLGSAITFAAKKCSCAVHMPVRTWNSLLNTQLTLFAYFPTLSKTGTSRVLEVVTVNALYKLLTFLLTYFVWTVLLLTVM